MPTDRPFEEEFDQLDEYSRVAVQHILGRFPEWRTRIVFPRPEGYDHAFADFEFPCPSPAIELGLWISTENHEVTVGLHTHHRHFTNYNEEFDAAHIEDALDCVQALLDERIIIVSWYCGERFAGSTSAPLTAAVPMSSHIKGITHATLRSWQGTYDRTIEGDESPPP